MGYLPIEDLTGQGRGKKAVVIGHGYSADNFDYTTIPDDYIIICVNCTEHIKKSRINYYVCYDKVQTAAIRTGKIKLSKKTKIISSIWGKDIADYYFNAYKFPPRNRDDLPPLRSGIRAIYIAQMMEFREIYIIGFDYMMITKNTDNHFSRQFQLTQNQDAIKKYLKDQVNEFNDINWTAKIFQTNRNSLLKRFPYKTIGKQQIKSQLCIFTHTPYDFIYSWHKKIFKNVHIFYDGNGQDSEIVTHQKWVNPMSILAKKIWPKALKLNADYYFMLENDAYIIDSKFEKRCIKYMRLNGIDILAPHLHIGDSHAFYTNEPQPSIIDKFEYWSILGCVVMTRQALDHYSKNLDTRPVRWHEIDFFTSLHDDNFEIRQNPYIKKEYFKFIKGGSLTPIDIIEAFKYKAGAVHPIKDKELLDEFGIR